VLITHEHFDHLEPTRLAKLPADTEIWTCEAVSAQLTDLTAQVRTVRNGDGFDTAGFRVDVVGEWHAFLLPDVPVIQNIGFMVEEEVFYPGDAFTPPGREVGTLLVPTGAPWLKIAEVFGYLRDIRPERAFSTHDALYSEVGLKLVDNWLGMEADKQKSEMRRLSVGESVTI
jgi:L-ascorbate metabolism protein UlaG (beta-lactamase superfamily)